MSWPTYISPLAIGLALSIVAGCKTTRKSDKFAAETSVTSLQNSVVALSDSADLPPVLIAQTFAEVGVDPTPTLANFEEVSISDDESEDAAADSELDTDQEGTFTGQKEDSSEPINEDSPGPKVEAKDNDLTKSKVSDSDSKSGDDDVAKGPSLLDPVVIASPIMPLSVAEAVQTALSSNKSIAVLGYSPQEASALWSSESAAFDPVLGISAKGNRFDRQLSSFIDSGGPIASNVQQTDQFGPTRQNNLSISKLLETGGTVEAGLGTNYLHQDPVGGLVFLNPSWRSALNLQFNQPLGRGRGRAVTTAPLRIAQVNSSQATHAFQASVNAMVRDVQLAYWNWKLAGLVYEVRTGAVAQATRTLEIENDRLDLEESTVPDVRQAEDQLQRFRVEAALAKNSLAQTKILLARWMGVTSSGMYFDAAIDDPDTESRFSREDGEVRALSRPELMAVDSSICAAQIALAAAADNLRPDLDMQFNYAITGLESQLDDSFNTVFDNRFNDWILGLDYKRAAGLRAAHASLRRARILLAQAIANRENVQLEIITDVALAWNDMQTQLETLEIQRERVVIAQQLLEGRDELYEEGEGSLDLKLRSESLVIDAKLAEVASEISLQQAIVRWQYSTGQQYLVQYASN